MNDTRTPFHEAHGISQNLMFERVTSVPARLSWGPRNSKGQATTIPGRGEAGWTVYGFKDAFEGARFVQAYRHAEMPCWARFEIINGELIQVR